MTPGELITVGRWWWKAAELSSTSGAQPQPSSDRDPAQTMPMTATRREATLITSLALSRHKKKLIKNHYSLGEGVKAEAQRSWNDLTEVAWTILDSQEQKGSLQAAPSLPSPHLKFTKGCFCLCRLSISAPVMSTLGRSSLRPVPFLYWIQNTHRFLNIQWSSDALKKMKPVLALIPAPVQRH